MHFAVANYLPGFAMVGTLVQDGIKAGKMTCRSYCITQVSLNKKHNYTDIKGSQKYLICGVPNQVALLQKCLYDLE